MQRPTVNIGDRQKGRMRAASVIDCPGEPEAILQAIHDALTLDCRNVKSPYGDGHAAERIISVLKKIKEPAPIADQSFHMRMTR